VGGTAGLAFSRYAIGYAETAFSPLGSNTVRPAPAGGPIDSSRLYDLNLGVHIRVPVRPRWAPYVILGGGVVWNAFNQSLAGPQGTATARHISNYDFGFHTGGGVRYYIRDNWGIRPEFEVVVSKQTYTRFSVGVFYTLPDTW
jgi:opacity protein-like surface antigen